MWFNFKNKAMGSATVRKIQSDINRGFGGSASAGETAYYNPVWDSLDEGSMVDSWIPRDLPRLNKMFRGIYLRDGVAGPTVDIWAGIPWSSFEIAGIEDPEIKQFYEDSLFPVFTPNFMEQLTKEYLITGRFCASMVFDNTKGYWTKLVPLDSDYLKITPIPRYGYDPIIDYRPNEAMKSWARSTDQRIIDSRIGIPQDYINAIINESEINLYPMNTLWVARQTSPNDYVGTSLYTRILPFWALEKPLINASIIASRRRAGSILHIKVGIEDKWDPTTEEMDQIGELFKKSDEDPTGAIVVTKTGIEPGEVMQGGNIWKISDEWDYLSNGKMRALGINDAFLSGESTYTSYEAAKSIFVEQCRNLRDLLTQKTINAKAESLARIHNFVKRSEAELSHGIRIKPSAQNITMEKALALPKNQLILPEIRWKKPLSPEGDGAELELLTTLADNGFPVNLRAWGASAGVNIDNFMEDLEEDLIISKKVGIWKKLKDEYEEGDFSHKPNLNPKQFEDEEDDIEDMEDMEDIEDMEEDIILDEEESFEEESKEEPEEKAPPTKEIEPASVGKEVLLSMINYIPWIDNKFVTADKDDFIAYINGKDIQNEYFPYLLARLGLKHNPISSEIAKNIWEWLPTKQKEKESIIFNKLGFLKEATL